MSKVKVVFNSCFGGFGLSAEAVNLYLEKSGSALPDEVSRHGPILVEVVEALDQVAAGFCSYLKIKEVGGPYFIDEYDGLEEVMEPHDIKWIKP